MSVHRTPANRLAEEQWRTAALRPLLDVGGRMRWREGRAGAHTGRVLISYTEFTPRRARYWPQIGEIALRLRAMWPALPGAIGMTLYLQPLRGRGGSLSVWEDEQALREFVALPYHLEIMRRYRDRGRLRSIRWWSETLDVGAALAHARTTLEQSS